MKKSCRSVILPYLAILGLVVAVIVTNVSRVNAEILTENFDRINDLNVGNFWLEVDSGTNLIISDGRLTDSPLSSSPARIGMIIRSFDIRAPIDFSMVITEGASANRYIHSLFINANGLFNTTSDPDNPLPAAYGIEIVRSGTGTNNSQVLRFDNGTRIADDQVFAPFQFTRTLRISASFASDGSITGTVSEIETSRSFSFSFGARTILSTGANVGVGMRELGSPPGATIDTLTITSTTTGISIGGSAGRIGGGSATKRIRFFEPVISFPNPVVGAASTITFAAVNTDTSDTVPANPLVTVTVSDFNGRAITKIHNPSATSTSVPWNTRNSRGEPLASGVYYYIVDFQNGKQGRGKFTLVR